MARKGWGIAWQVSREELENVCREATTLTQILDYVGLKHRGGNAASLKSRLKYEGISIDHISKGSGWSLGKKLKSNPLPLENVLVENSTYSRGNLKKRLISNGMLVNQCAHCGQQPEWQGKPLVMIIDHINGVNTDNRIENLRLLCPNCNTQTPTFSGRNLSSREATRQRAEAKRLARMAKTKAFPKPRPRKVERPSPTELKEMLWSEATTTIAKRFGVSDNAVAQWAKRYGIDKPPRGYWAKKRAGK